MVDVLGVLPGGDLTVVHVGAVYGFWDESAWEGKVRETGIREVVTTRWIWCRCNERGELPRGLPCGRVIGCPAVELGDASAR